MKLFTYSSETDVLEIIWDFSVERRVREEVGFDLFLDPDSECIGVRIPGFSNKTGDIDKIHALSEELDRSADGSLGRLQHTLVHLSNMVNSQRAFFLHDSHFGFVLQNWNDGEIAEGASPPEPEDDGRPV